MKLKKWALVAFAFSASSQVCATDLNFRGFGSFTGGQTLGSDEAIFSYDHEVDFRNESLIALQSEAKMDDGLSATMQLIARGKNDYKPLVEWAYVSYDINENFRLNAGRMRTPFYRYSDFIDVRYTYNWLQIPRTVYGLDLPGFDGLSLVHTKSYGSWDSTLQLIYGRVESESDNTPLTVEDNVGINWSVNRDWLTLRAGFLRSNITLPIEGIEQLAAGIVGFGKGVGTDLSGFSDKLRVNGDSAYFASFAMGIDYNNYLFDAEFITSEIDNSLLAKTDAFYAGVGYRFNKWIPLITYSQSRNDANTDIIDSVPASVAGIPFGQASFGHVIEGIVGATNEELDLIDFTLRYDFHSSAALKLSLTQTDDNKGGDNNLLRFGIDLVF